MSNGAVDTMSNKTAECMMNDMISHTPNLSEDKFKAISLSIIALDKRDPEEPYDGKCPCCGKSVKSLMKALRNEGYHKVVYCWNCGKAIKTDETGGLL